MIIYRFSKLSLFKNCISIQRCKGGLREQIEHYMRPNLGDIFKSLKAPARNIRISFTGTVLDLGTTSSIDGANPCRQYNDRQTSCLFYFRCKVSTTLIKSLTNFFLSTSVKTDKSSDTRRTPPQKR